MLCRLSPSLGAPVISSLRKPSCGRPSPVGLKTPGLEVRPSSVGLCALKTGGNWRKRRQVIRQPSLPWGYREAPSPPCRGLTGQGGNLPHPRKRVMMLGDILGCHCGEQPCPRVLVPCILPTALRKLCVGLLQGVIQQPGSERPATPLGRRRKEGGQDRAYRFLLHLSC